MSKNKKARITLEFAIGLVLSILILIAVLNIVGGLFRLNDSSKQSFDKLVSLIKDVNKKSPAGTVKTTALRMDKETFVVGFPKNNEPAKIWSYEAESGIAQVNYFYIFNKPSPEEGCKEGKACMCLCRKLGKINKKEGATLIELKCEDNNLFCETLDDLEFPYDIPPPSETASTVLGDYKLNGFIISRLDMVPNKDYSQFRTVFVEKYKGPDGEMVAVCENPEDGSCVSEKYKEQSEAIEGLKELAKFIELCKKTEFLGKPCACGPFDFKSEILEGYSIELSESDEKLKLTLKKGKNSIGEPLIVDTNFCVYHIHIKKENPIDKPKKITLDHNLNSDYIFYYENYPDSSEVHKNYLEALKLEENCDNSPEDYKSYEDAVEKWQKSRERYFQEYTDYKPENPHISFIKYDEGNVCLAQYNSNIDDGYIKPNPDPEPFGTIWIMYKTSGDLIEDQVNKIKGCKYPEEVE